ncbi:MAG: glycosyltransferase family 4 protein [Pseudomonadota bacterium]
MNIGYFGSRMDLISGHSRPVLQMAMRLQQRGHGVRVLSTALSPSRQRYHQALASTSSVPVERPFDSLRQALFVSRPIHELIEWCDVLHELSPYGTGLLLAGRKFRVPRVITVATSLRIQLKDFLAVAGWDIRRWVQARHLIHAVAPDILYRVLLRRADAVICWSDYVNRQLHTIGVPDHRVHRIPVAVYPTRFPQPPGLRRHEGEPAFLYLGPLTRIRGADDLIRAFADFYETMPSARLIIADRGADVLSEEVLHRRGRRYYQQLCSSLGISHAVKWIGFQEDMAGTIRGADAVVLPFRLALGYSQPPLSVLEAMALGKPVISTSCGCLPELIESGVNGLLVPPGDIPSLTRAMYRIANERLSLSPGQIQTRVASQHPWEDAVEETLRVYESVLPRG